ncbi:unnamed protein product, partial [Didymodactylos carnosus]
WRQICNGIIDCFNNSLDEENCLELELNECDNQTEYRCQNGMYIPKSFSFDTRISDCMYGSDEQFMDGLNDNYYKKISVDSEEYTDLTDEIYPGYCREPNDIECLFLQKVGDGRIDCLGAIDERTNYCSHITNFFSFKCLDSDECIITRLICDGHKSCPLADDEQVCSWQYPSRDCQRSEFVCKNKTCINRSLRCDLKFDCLEGEDEWFCDLTEKILIKIPSFDGFNQYPLTYNNNNQHKIIIKNNVKQWHPYKGNMSEMYLIWCCTRGISDVCWIRMDVVQSLTAIDITDIVDSSSLMWMIAR